MLRVDGLTAGYGKVVIVRDICIDVKQGEVVAVIGRNGVGKSTLMKTLMGLLKVREGKIALDGVDVTGFEAFKRARLGMGYVPQGRGVFPKLTVAENLAMGELINHASGDKRIDWIYEYFPRLAERKRQKAGTMSGGEQSMLVIGRALVGKPNVLILDEPSEGLQPNIVQQIGDIVRQINESMGVTVLIVEQNMDLIQRMAQRAYLMDNGRIVGSLGHEELSQREIIAAHLSV